MQCRRRIPIFERRIDSIRKCLSKDNDERFRADLNIEATGACPWTTRSSCLWLASRISMELASRAGLCFRAFLFRERAFRAAFGLRGIRLLMLLRRCSMLYISEAIERVRSICNSNRHTLEIKGFSAEILSIGCSFQKCICIIILEMHRRKSETSTGDCRFGVGLSNLASFKS